MRISPLNVVDGALLEVAEREQLGNVAARALSSGTIDLEKLPLVVRDQLLATVDAYARGELVATVTSNKPLTSTEAAKLLGMSRTHLTRLCDDGTIDSFKIGNAIRIPVEEALRILAERDQAREQAQEAAATVEQRRRSRAARSAGLL